MRSVREDISVLEIKDLLICFMTYLKFFYSKYEHFLPSLGIALSLSAVSMKLLSPYNMAEKMPGTWQQQGAPESENCSLHSPIFFQSTRSDLFLKENPPAGGRGHGRVRRKAAPGVQTPAGHRPPGLRAVYVPRGAVLHRHHLWNKRKVSFRTGVNWIIYLFFNSG